MQRSPIQHMQQAMLRSDRMSGFGRLADSMMLAGLGAGSLVQQGITGVKAGATAAGISSAAIGSIGAFAAAGSVVPVIGTAIGVIVGLVASGVFSHRVDPEVGNFNNAMALARAQGPQAVLGIQDKYLVLAGLFDLEPGQIKGNIPIYKKYGRKGEFHFVNDMCALIQSAANQGLITANDTVQSVYDKIVAPWINGFGYGPMQDSNAEMITYIIIGLIGEYVTGQYKQRWYARGGDFPFGGLQPFTLPMQAAVSPGPSGTPTQGPAPPAQLTAPMIVPAQPGLITAPAQPVPSGFMVAAQSGIVQQPQSQPLQYQQTPVQPVQSQYPQFAPVPPIQPPSYQFAPAQPVQPVTAGITGAGLPSWLPWGAVAGVLLLMFATARPMGPLPRRRS